MAKQRISLGNIGKGITPNISDKSSDGWKQMNNIERDDLLGAIKPRDGAASTSLYTGGVAPGSSIITTTITPIITDDPRTTSLISYYPGYFSYFSDWVTTTPTLGFKFAPKTLHYVNSIVLNNIAALGNWAAVNPNSKMTITLRKATIDNIKTYVSGTSGPWYFRYLWTLTDTLGSATVNIGGLTETEQSLIFNIGTNVKLEPGIQYFLQVNFTDLTVPMGGLLSVTWRGAHSEFNTFSNCLLVGGEEASNQHYSTGMAVDFIGASPISSSIENMVYAEQYKDDMLVVLNNGTQGRINISEDHLTLKDITPADCNAPDERYGLSLLQKNGSYYMSFLSALLQPSKDTNNIIYYRKGMPTGAMVENIKENITTSLVNSSQPPLIYQYGVQYIYPGFNTPINMSKFFATYSTKDVAGTPAIPYLYYPPFSTTPILKVVLPTQGYSGVPVTWTNNAGANPPPVFNAPTAKLSIPLKNMVSTDSLPAEIRIYRKAIKNYAYGTEYVEKLNAQSFQLIATYSVPPDNVSDTYEFTDNVPRVESGDFFIAPDAPYIPAMDLPVYPTPGFIFDYYGRTLALGDRNNRHVVYFSYDSDADFFADNVFSLQLPQEDYFLSGGFTLGDNAYVSSPHAIWRVSETSTSLPYYRIEKVRGADTIGIMSPKTILVIQGKAYFLSTEGFMSFDGTNAVSISLEIDNYIKGIDKEYRDAMGNKVNPSTSDCFYQPYLAEAVYDAEKSAIYLAIPYGNSKVNNMCLKYCMFTKTWETVDIADFRGLVLRRANTVTVRTDDIIMDINNPSKRDTAYGSDTVVVPTLETNDTVLPDKARINRIIIYGTGTINFYAYTDRGDTPKVTKLGVTLRPDGTDIPLNVIGFEFRYKIEGVSADFSLTTSPKIDVTGSGLKSRRDVE